MPRAWIGPWSVLTGMLTPSASTLGRASKPAFWAARENNWLIGKSPLRLADIGTRSHRTGGGEPPSTRLVPGSHRDRTHSTGVDGASGAPPPEASATVSYAHGFLSDRPAADPQRERPASTNA